MRTQGASFAIFLGALAALPPIAIDMVLPALGTMERDLGAAQGRAGLTLSVFMAGFAFSPIVYGPLADRKGRRPMLMVGLVLFVIGGFAATIASSMPLLLAARLVQGAGAGAGMTIAMAIVRDLFKGRAAQTRLAVITIVANVAPILAPAIGAGLMIPIGWRGIYGVTALCGLLLLLVVSLSLAETLRPTTGKLPPLVRKLMADYRTVLSHRGVVSHIVLNALGFGWMFAYVSGSSLLFMDVLGLSGGYYAGAFACTGAGIVIGAILNGRLATIGVRSQALLEAGVIAATLAGLALTVLAVTDRISVLGVLPLLVIVTGAFGMVAPSAAHGALEPVPDQAGVAGGVLTSLQMLSGALASSLVSLLFPHFGVLAMTSIISVLAILGLVLVATMKSTLPTDERPAPFLQPGSTR
ncbi:multidrug effflux MFS transporter [Sphingomonas sp. Leaf25]|uniref:multidrug effflux MFS transporter n=1 Tax=Sphingomonas sp. Leaf25 TaxID=1735692 RepID=UPI0006F279AE|nr:multidrug effflux MFS transporter [Sphingomonas sp. Leaf25]KQM99382.1 hypothetical protein ASE78_17870 [Sphingomonas sp. Leaf25]